jgi:hypothetical protein
VKITVPLVRDLVTLALGSGGMVHELFLVSQPNMVRVSVSIGLLLGPAALYAAWRLRNPEPPQPTPSGVGSPSSPSSSSPPGS